MLAYIGLVILRLVWQKSGTMLLAALVGVVAIRITFDWLHWSGDTVTGVVVTGDTVTG